MESVPVLFAKLAGLHKAVTNRLNSGHQHFEPPSVMEYFEQFHRLQDRLKEVLPDLYADMLTRELPKPRNPREDLGFEGPLYIGAEALKELLLDLDYIFEVRAPSQLGSAQPEKRPDREGE